MNLGVGPSRKTALLWTEITPPDDSCWYDHITAKTAVGEYSIEWKSWKWLDMYDLYLLTEDIEKNCHIGRFSTLDEAKEAAESYHKKNHT